MVDTSRGLIGHTRNMTGGLSVSMRTVVLSPARPEDSAALLAWRNDPMSVAASLDRQPVEDGDHQRWFARVIVDPRRSLYIGRDSISGERVGMCRFDRAPERAQAVVSINVAPQWRGKGVGTLLLQESLARHRKEHPSTTTILAQIRSDNVASVRLFESSGFSLVDTLDGVHTLSIPLT